MNISEIARDKQLHLQIADLETMVEDLYNGNKELTKELIKKDAEIEKLRREIEKLAQKS